jgi:hypothetical protein
MVTDRQVRRLFDVQNFAPMGASPGNISSWESYDNRREEIIVAEGKL